MTSAVRKYMTESKSDFYSEEDKEPDISYTSSLKTDSSNQLLQTDNPNDSSSSSFTSYVGANENEDLGGSSLLIQNYRLKARYLILQIYGYFNFVVDLYPSVLIIMINAPLYAIVDFTLKCFGISQNRVNRKLLKNILLLLIMTIAFVHSKKNIVHQAFETQQLFPEHSIVTDYYKGELSLLRSKILHNDVTIVMFYAPWDRQSVNFASHFLKAAHYHQDQVAFVAINCWLPKSECKSHFKLYYYPIIILHVKISTVDESYIIPYNGPLSSDHLIRFISNALHPFVYVSEKTGLLDLQLFSQVIVLGYFDLQKDKEEFLAFYLASVSKLQHEHLSGVIFAVVTDHHLAQKLMFFNVPAIHLMQWNATMKVYPKDVAINVNNITSFIGFHMKEVSSWLRISGKKSLTLNRIFQDGPFLALFTPYNPYHRLNGPFQLLRSVAFEYFNCENISIQTWLADHFYLRSLAEMGDLNLECRKHLKDRDNRGTSVLKGKKFSDDFQFVEEPLKTFCELEEPTSYRFTWESIWNSFSKRDSLNLEGGHCLRDREPANSCSNQNLPPINKETPFVHGGPREDDKIDTLIDSALEDCCKRLILGSNVSYSYFVMEEDEKEKKVNINGLSCETNRTLQFVAIDSNLHSDFANHIGLTFNQHHDKEPDLTGVVLVDPEREERFFLQEKLSRNSLAQFVYNFTHNLLDRGKRFSRTLKNESQCADGEVCILELNGEDYMQVIRRPKQVTIGFHYSHHCGACSAISSVLLTCRHLTSHLSNLAFVRIDVSRNTLPWHLTFESVPTILFHPHDHKSETRVFNPELPVTVRNLMSFIVSGLKPAERNSVALNLCDAKCRNCVRSQSLVLKIKYHHSLNVLSLRVKRYITLLVNIQHELTQSPDNTLLQSKYNLLVEVKSYLINKISILKGKLSHLNQIDHISPFVPFNYL